MSIKILVMSCDKNHDIFDAFHHCMEKYWVNHPEIIYSLETFTNPYYKTINKNIPLEKWSKRVLETVKEIDADHILFMIDDLFIREKVDNDRIIGLCKWVVDNIAALNLEPSFDPLDKPLTKDIMIRNRLGNFKTSCMCQIWQKKAMLRLFNTELNPWQFEKANMGLSYDFLISKNGDFLKFGKKRNEWRFGLVKGKWTKECKEFLESENIPMNYVIRGFIKE